MTESNIVALNTSQARPRKSESRTRRTFTTEYKLSILNQAITCKRGELGELLRCEKLYSNQLLNGAHYDLMKV